VRPVLAVLQKYLTDIYQADHGFSVTDFLITDPALAGILGSGALVPNTDESVLLSQEGDDLSLSVYLDEDVLKRLDEADPLTALKAAQLDDLCKVLEGISHFNYIVWRARQDQSVTLLELEMQAEVDKFVSTWRMALDQNDYELARRLHGWLFDDVSFNPELDREQAERYRAANAFAARFCHGLAARLDRDGDTGLDELRRFYRLSQTDKISHINAKTWAL
jgi:hypothetical protein